LGGLSEDVALAPSFWLAFGVWMSVRRPNFLAAALHFMPRPALPRSSEEAAKARRSSRHRAALEAYGGLDDLSALVAEYEALARALDQVPDAFWQVSVRWSFGRCLGWFVERGGYLEHGPYRTQSEAEASMRALLRAAVLDLQGGIGR
jgi:hypothetical protein